MGKRLGRRSRLLVGFASLTGASRLKPLIDDSLLLGNRDTGDFAHSLFNPSVENLNIDPTSKGTGEADEEDSSVESKDSTTTYVDSIVHPACEAKGMGPSEGIVEKGVPCPCQGFYDGLIEICNKAVRQRDTWNFGDKAKHAAISAFTDWDPVNNVFKRRLDCPSIIYKLWNDAIDNDEKIKDLVSKLYLEPDRITNVSVPVFWAGFSWTLGTRQTMDELLFSASEAHGEIEIDRYREMKNTSLTFFDIEHKDTPIGNIMRSRNWDRKCHASEHDSNLWVALSKIFANAARKKADLTNQGMRGAVTGAKVGAVIGVASPFALLAAHPAFFTFAHPALWPILAPILLASGIALGVTALGAGVGAAKAIDFHLEDSMVGMVQILINRPVEKLARDSFLVRHELANLHVFHNIMVWDFKCDCSPSLMQLIAMRTHNDHEDQVGRLPVITCVSANAIAIRHGRERFFSSGDYSNVVHRLSSQGSVFNVDQTLRSMSRGRQMNMLSSIDISQGLLKTADTVISKLEACYTDGIVWRNTAQVINASTITGNTSEDMIKQCQKLCGTVKSCSHFNLFQGNQSCELLDRKDTLHYELTDEKVTSGRPDKNECSEEKEKIREAALRAQKEKKKIREAKKMKTQALELEGDWSYKLGGDREKITYSLSFEDGEHIIFREPSAGAEGRLRFRNGWFEGDIKVGSIKLRLNPQGNIVSQFKRKTEDEWGKETIASKQVGTWSIISSSRSCSRNNEGIRKAEAVGYVRTLVECKDRCLARAGCAAIDYYTSTGWCNTYDAACTTPQTTNAGASSYKYQAVRYEVGQAVDYSSASQNKWLAARIEQVLHHNRYVVTVEGGGRRVVTKDTLRRQSQALTQVGIIDVTNLVGQDAFANSGYRCCCDNRKTGPFGNRGSINNAEYPNYCVIAKTPSCKNVAVRYDTMAASDYDRYAGECEILQDDVPDLVKALNASDYCPQNEYMFMDMTVNIAAAAIGQIRDARCTDGSLGNVTCQVGTPSVGYWSPVQCEFKNLTWCPAMPKNRKSVPEIPEIKIGGFGAAQLGNESEVLCDTGFPSTGKTICSEQGWIPESDHAHTEWDMFGFPPVCFQFR